MSTLPEPMGVTNPSWAYSAIQERGPQIFAEVREYFRRNYMKFVDANNGNAGKPIAGEVEADAQVIMEDLAQLREGMIYDGPLTPLTDGGEDVAIWSQCFDSWSTKLGSTPTFHSVSYLYSECFAYRKLRDIFAKSRFFDKFDPFMNKKHNAIEQSVQSVIILGEHVASMKVNSETLRAETIKMIEISLWGNKCDLSLSGGKDCSQKSNPLDNLIQIRPNILINDSEQLYSTIERLSQSKDRIFVDMVLDNAGFELFTDLCFIEHLHSSGLLPVDKCVVRWYVKTIPWFVSDTMRDDFNWTVDYCINCPESSLLQGLGNKWKEYLTKGTWLIVEDCYWTLPYDYSCMKALRPSLYNQISQAGLVIFKGDLNYRKLVGDLDWDKKVPFERALRGFHPTNLCALRSIKAEICVGLKDDSLWTSLPGDWMTSSDFAVISFGSNQ